MAASSHYRCSTPAPHSHYHMSSDPDSLYAGLATSWSSPQGAASRGPATSALLPRFGLPAHRPLPPQADPRSTDYVNPPPPNPPAWSSTYLRPPLQEWNPLPDGFPSRQLAYPESDARLPAPHANPPALNRPLEHQHQHQHQHHGPPFSAEASTLAPVARILNYTNPDINVPSQHPPPQPVVDWPQGAAPELAVTAPPPAFTHPTDDLPQDVVLAGQGHLSGSAWPMVTSASSDTPVSAFDQLQDTSQSWPDTQTTQLDRVPSAPAFRALTASRSGRVATPKKNVPKVPAAFVARQQKSKISRRRGPLDEAGRQKTHKMRKEKNTCIRCRFYKSGCDHGDICEKCLKVLDNARSFKVPCTRVRLEDAVLVRHCNGRSNQEEGEFLGYDWLGGVELFEMDINWNLPGAGPIQAHPMRVLIRQYHPKGSLLDTATSVWSNTEGQVKVVQQPPYAIYDTASLLPAFERYFGNLQPAVEQWIFERIRHDQIASLTYREVMRVRSKRLSGARNLLDLAMKIQCLSIMSQGYGTVWSNNVPGIMEYDYGKMGRSSYEAYDRNSRDRPLPGAIHQQMDVAALKYLRKLEKQALKVLSSLTFKSRIRPWYELFLALYVVFWNMEYIRNSAEKYMLSKNGTVIEDHVSNVVSKQLRKWEGSFQNLMYHWMAIMRDYPPFRLARENPEELREKGHLDSEGFEYVVEVARTVDRMGGIRQSTSPYVGVDSTHNSLSSDWIKSLFTVAGL